MTKKYDLIIVGAGPAGLAINTYAKRSGLSSLVLEKGCLVNSIYHFPESMTFFTTAELLEIGEVPFIVHAEKPKRVDALKYYRRVTQEYSMNVRDFEKVISIAGSDMDFRIVTVDRFGHEHEYPGRKVVIATGYFDHPNLLGIPGEDLAKVSHYYTDPHPYFGKKVAVIGGKNSAAIAALELFRNGCEVTLIHRGVSMGREVKYWIRPDIENRIKNGEIATYFQSKVVEIREKEIVIATPEEKLQLENDFVFALTGYHPDSRFLRQIGIEVDSETYIPSHNPSTLESNVKGIYLAGSIVSGRMTNRIFIENGRFHGGQIVPDIVAALERVNSRRSG